MNILMSFIFAEAQVRIHHAEMGSIAITDGTSPLGGNSKMPSGSCI